MLGLLLLQELPGQLVSTESKGLTELQVQLRSDQWYHLVLHIRPPHGGRQYHLITEVRLREAT